MTLVRLDWANSIEAKSVEEKPDIPEPRKMWPHEWKCIRCKQVVGALGENTLNVLVEMHNNEHKRLDRAWNIVSDPTVWVLTPYDIKFLTSLKIQVDDGTSE